MMMMRRRRRWCREDRGDAVTLHSPWNQQAAHKSSPSTPSNDSVRKKPPISSTRGDPTTSRLTCVPPTFQVISAVGYDMLEAADHLLGAVLGAISRLTPYCCCCCC